jgi:hypothetical protein
LLVPGISRGDYLNDLLADEVTLSSEKKAAVSEFQAAGKSEIACGS